MIIMKKFISRFEKGGKKWEVSFATNLRHTWFEVEEDPGTNYPIEEFPGFVVRKEVEENIPRKYRIEDFLNVVRVVVSEVPEVFEWIIDRGGFQLFENQHKRFDKEAMKKVGFIDNLIEGGDKWLVALIQILFCSRCLEKIRESAVEAFQNPDILDEVEELIMTMLMVYEGGFELVDYNRVFKNLNEFVKNIKKYLILKYRHPFFPEKSSLYVSHFTSFVS